MIADGKRLSTGAITYIQLYDPSGRKEIKTHQTVFSRTGSNWINHWHLPSGKYFIIKYTRDTNGKEDVKIGILEIRVQEGDYAVLEELEDYDKVWVKDGSAVFTAVAPRDIPDWLKKIIFGRGSPFRALLEQPEQ
ncbi:MAG: hypothetical protein ACE5Z5_13000 [Candidatus Bathyarchaeia archaeon]